MTSRNFIPILPFVSAKTCVLSSQNATKTMTSFMDDLKTKWYPLTGRRHSRHAGVVV